MAGNDKDMEKYLETLRKQKVEKEASKLSSKTNMTMEEARALLEAKSQEQVRKQRAERQLNALMEDRQKRETAQKEAPRAELKEEILPELPDAVSEQSIPEVSPDPMDRYTRALKETPSGKKVVAEQDLQNTPATMKELKNLELSIRNIQTSLTSLGGGGLGEMDVLRLIADNATNLDSADLDYIASQVGDDFLDSAEAIKIINETVDSAFVNALVDASVSDALDSAEAIKLIGETVDSAYVNALVDINTSLDSSDYQEIADRIDDEFTDSAEVLQLINETVDSAYVNALVDAGLADAFDSAEVVNVIHDTVDDNYITDRIGVPLDSSDIQPMIDASIAGLDTYDSAQVLGQITATVDSGYVNALVDINTSLDSNDYDAIADRVSDDFIDSVEAVALINRTVDSAYVNALVDPADVDAFDSSEVVDLITNTVDSSYIDGLGFAQTDEIQPKIDATFASAPNLIPADATSSLGDSDNPWAELYVSGNSIHLGSLKLTDDTGSFKVVNDSSDEVVKINLEDNVLNEIGDVTLDLANLDSDDFLVWDGTKWVNRELDLSGLEFKQTVDLTTDTAPATPSTGDLYINTTSGTVDASWTGIGGQTVSELQAVVWSGTSSQWYLTNELGSGAVTSIGSSTASLRVDDTNASTPVLSIASASADSAGLMSSAHYTKVESGLDSDIDALQTLLEGKVDSDVNALSGRMDGLDSDIQVLRDADSALNVRIDGIDSDFVNITGDVMTGTLEAPELRAKNIDSGEMGKVLVEGWVGDLRAAAQILMSNKQFNGSQAYGTLTFHATNSTNAHFNFNKDVTVNGNLTVNGNKILKTNKINSVGDSNVSLQRNDSTKILLADDRNINYQRAKYNADYGITDDMDIPHKLYVDSSIDSAISALGIDSDLADQVAENTENISANTAAILKNTLFNSHLIEEGVAATTFESIVPISNAFQDIANRRIIGWTAYGISRQTNGGNNGIVATPQLNIVDMATGDVTTRGILNPKKVANNTGNRYEHFTFTPPFKLGDDWIFTPGENAKDQPFFKLKPDNTFEPYGLNQAGYVDSADNANALPKVNRSWSILNHRVRLDPHIDTPGFEGGRYHLICGNPTDRVDTNGGNHSKQAQAVLLLDAQDLIDGNEVETYDEDGKTYSTLTKTLSTGHGGYPAVITNPDGSPDIYLLQPGRKIKRVVVNDLAAKSVSLQDVTTDALDHWMLIDSNSKFIAEGGKINGVSVIDNRYIVYHATNVGIMCFDTKEQVLTKLVETLPWVAWGTNRTMDDQSVPHLFGGTYFFPSTHEGQDGNTHSDTKGYRISDTLEVTEIEVPYTFWKFKSQQALGPDKIGLSNFDGKITTYNVLQNEWEEEVINGRVMGTFPLLTEGDVDAAYVPLVFNEQGLNNPSDPWVPEKFFKVSEGLNHDIIAETNFLHNEVIKEHDDFVKTASQNVSDNAMAFNMAHTNRSAIISNRDAIDDILFPTVKVATENENEMVTGLYELADIMAPEEDDPLYHLIDQNFVLFYKMYEGKGEPHDRVTLQNQRYSNDHLNNLMMMHIPTGKTKELTGMRVHRPDDAGLPDGESAGGLAAPCARGIHMIPHGDGSLDCYLWIHNPLRTVPNVGASSVPKGDTCPLYRIHIPATADIDSSNPFANVTENWTNIRCAASDFTYPAEHPYKAAYQSSVPGPPDAQFVYEIHQNVFNMVDPRTNKRHYFAMSYVKSQSSTSVVTHRVFEYRFDDNDPDAGEIVPVQAHFESNWGEYASGFPCKKKDIHDVERVFLFGAPTALTEVYMRDDPNSNGRIPELRNYADYIPMNSGWDGNGGGRVVSETETNAMGHPLILERGIYDNWYKMSTLAIQPLTLNPYDVNDELSNVLVWYQSGYGICSLSVKDLGNNSARTRLENNYQGTNLSAMMIENRPNIYNGYSQESSSKNLMRFQSKIVDTHSFGSLWFFDYKSDFPFDTDGTDIKNYDTEQHLYNDTRVFDDDGNLVEQLVFKRPILELRPNESTGKMEIHCIPVGQKHHPSQVVDVDEEFSGEGLVKVNDVFLCTGAAKSHGSIVTPQVYMFNPKSRTVQKIDTTRVDMTSPVASRQHGTVFGAPYGESGDTPELGTKIHMIDMLGVENSSQPRSQAKLLRKVYELTGNESLIATDPDTWTLDSEQSPVYYDVDHAADSDWDFGYLDSAGLFSDSA